MYLHSSEVGTITGNDDFAREIHTILNELLIIFLVPVVCIDKLAGDIPIGTQTMKSRNRISILMCIWVSRVSILYEVRSPSNLSRAIQNFQDLFNACVQDRVIGVYPCSGSSTGVRSG